MTRIFLFVFIVSLFFLGCDKKTEDEKKTLAVSIYPIYDMVRNLAAWDWEISLIVPGGVNPHSYEPLPSEVAEFYNADLFIGVDENFDGWVTDYMSENTSIKYLQENIGFSETQAEDDYSDSHDAEEEEHEDEEDQHLDNPHIWLSISNAMLITEQITEYLIEIDPENEEEYLKRKKSYLILLSETDKQIREILTNLEGEQFFQWHPAWDYFADDYGLEVAGTIEEGHGQEPTLSEMSGLIRTAWRDDVRVIVVGLNVESKAAQALKPEIAGKIINLDSIGNPDTQERDTYITMMVWNAEQLAAALK